MTKKVLAYACILSLLVFAPGFQKEKGPDRAVVEKGIEIKLKQYRERKEKECQEKALARALVVADSLMATRALIIKNDTINRPPRAVKPVKPDFVPIPDSISVEPILKKG